MRSALVGHDKVLRSAIEAYDGFLSSHTGDGLAAAFASPMSAVNAAIDAPTGVAVAGANGIGNRRGRAARRGLLRNGAQSSRASDGGRSRWPGLAGRVNGESAQWSRSARSGAATVAGCPHAGRGVPGSSTWTAGRVSAVAGARYNSGELRPATTSLVGRESEVPELQAAVKAHRLVTLTGVGGVGKTRLAVEVAAQLADVFPDGGSASGNFMALTCSYSGGRRGT
jgi:hypothetical protein